MTALGLFTGRAPARRRYTEPFTQTRLTTSGGEAQEVRYHVVVEALAPRPVQHIAVQFRPPPGGLARDGGSRWTTARQALCEAAFDALASAVQWESGRWCQQCRDVARAELR